ncbi:MAG: transcription-repair coupling factor, partial [Gammaproteobacteria bacterium]|nr:transcription-repair coupling factor [Gammaproteobacteria bacterium]
MKNNQKQFYHKSSPIEEKMTYWPDLNGCEAAFAIASITTAGPLLIVTPDLLTTQHLEQELQFFLKKDKKHSKILTFPGWETLPYDHFSPHEDIISQRLQTLYQLILIDSGVIFVTAAALMHRLPPKYYVEANSFVLNIGEKVDLDALRKKFENHGYNHVTKVMEHGEFAVRGSIIDIFPMGSKSPFRIDFLDTTVDSIRVFDVDTQRSFKVINNIKLLPAKEFPLDELAIERFCHSWRSRFGGNPLNSPIYQAISSNKTHPGIEYYL